MPTAWCFCSGISHASSVIVAGGITNYNPVTLTSSVEALHIKEEGWFSRSYWSAVKQLPFRASCLDTLVNDDKLYIVED